MKDAHTKNARQFSLQHQAAVVVFEAGERCLIMQGPPLYAGAPTLHIQ